MGQPGIYAQPNGGVNWALQDIHAISHEIAEWADDPFVNNTVEPWLTPTAPQYGCTDILETGNCKLVIVTYINCLLYSCIAFSYPR